MVTQQLATRLTCFALISAIEGDLRRECKDLALISDRQISFPIDVLSRATERFKKDPKNQVVIPSSHFELLEYTDFADLAKILNSLAAEFANRKSVQITPISEQLERLASVRNRVCHSRPLEAEDFSKLHDFSLSLSSNHGPLRWSAINEALDSIRDSPRSVLQLIIPDFWKTDSRAPQNNLPLPDFDDTGFVGRSEDRKNVTRHLLSVHPIVTIVGEGGLGKTALALRCLYDILEDPHQRFDALIWFSLKSRRLTAHGVIEIQEAITSELGILRSAASELSAEAHERHDIAELIAELKTNLADFKILLTIDNLETIDWEPLRPLLSEVPANSKILITSRIGLGELEVRYPVKPLDAVSAVTLARLYAKILNLSSLYEAKEQTLRTYCQHLYYNPLLIKWFIAGVATGCNPAALQQKSGASFQSAIQFCFENLFSRLDSIQRELCHVLDSAGQPITRTELYLFTDHLDHDAVDMALTGLNRCSIINLNSSGRGELQAAKYSLSPIAAEYLKRQSRPTPEIYNRTHAKQRELRNLLESASVQRAAHKYDPFAIEAVTREEQIAAVYLSRAIASFNYDWNLAFTQLEEAKRLNPTFFEVYRVSGVLEAKRRRLYEAGKEFETAISYAPKSARTRYSYALFLLQKAEDYEGALLQIDEAVNQDPNTSALLAVKAQVLMRLGRYKDAIPIYESLMPALSAQPLKWRISTRDQAAECYRRWSERDRSMKDNPRAWLHLCKAMELMELSMHSREFDQRILGRLGDILSEAMSVAVLANDDSKAEQIIKWLHNLRGELGHHVLQIYALDKFTEHFNNNSQVRYGLDGIALEGTSRAEAEQIGEASKLDEQSGTIDQVNFANGFGFLVDKSGKRLYFNRKAVSCDWNSLKSGELVQFNLGENKQGPCAVRVRRE